MPDIAPAPTAPAPTPTPSPAPTPTPDRPTTPVVDKFSELDSRVAKKREAVKPTPDKPAESDKADVTPKPDDKKAEVVKDPKQLRERLAQVERELAESHGSVSEFKKKIADYESRGVDTTALTKQLAAEQKEKAELQSQIRALKREASPEFKEKWDKPFDQALAFAKQFVEQLQVVDEEKETTRAGTWDDFVSLYQLPHAKAVAMARQLFGEASSGVVQQLTELKKIDFQRNSALKEEQVKWQQTEEQDRAREVQQREYIEKTWGTVNKDIADRHPEWFGDDPKDAEGNAILKEGFALVDSKPASLQEKIVKDAHVRLKAAAFPRLVHKYTQLQERNQELEAKIAELQGSKPGSVIKSGSTTPDKASSRKGVGGLSQDLADALKG